MSLFVAGSSINLGIFVRLTKGKTSGVRTVRNFFQFFTPSLTNFVFFNIRKAGINSLAVGAYNSSNIVHALHSAFNFQTAYARTNKFRQIVNKAQVLTIHNVSTALIFLDVELFTGAIFFHNGVIPTASLRTSTAVTVTTSKERTQKATTGIRNAHCTMYESFQFNGSLFANFCDFSKGKFARQNNAFSTKCFPSVNSFKVGSVCLSANMQRHIGNNTLCYAPHTQIRNKQCIYACFFQAKQILR